MHRGKPQVFDNLERAIGAAQGLQHGNPGFTYDVKQFMGESRYVFEIFVNGEWQIAAQPAARVTPGGQVEKNPEMFPEEREREC